MQTSVTRFLGIEDPIVQAPIGGLSNPRLAAAVSNAGGLGMIAMTWMAPDEIREVVRATRVAHLRAVRDQPDPRRASRRAARGGTRDRGEGRLLLLGRSRAVPAPPSTTPARWRCSPWAAPRRRVPRSTPGVDVIVAQGWEAGGHVWGEVSTLALVPAVVDAVGNVPVIAAGGIVDGRGLAAVLTLGAGAAWMGTRFVASEEAPAHPDYIARVIEADETDTFHSKLFDVGWPDAAHRVLRNATVDAWEAAGRPASGNRPGEGEVLAHRPDGRAILRYESVAVRVGTTGNVGDLSLWAGQGVGPGPRGAAGRADRAPNRQRGGGDPRRLRQPGLVRRLPAEARVARPRSARQMGRCRRISLRPEPRAPAGRTPSVQPSARRDRRAPADRRPGEPA